MVASGPAPLAKLASGEVSLERGFAGFGGVRAGSSRKTRLALPFSFRIGRPREVFLVGGLMTYSCASTRQARRGRVGDRGGPRPPVVARGTGGQSSTRRRTPHDNQPTREGDGGRGGAGPVGGMKNKARLPIWIYSQICPRTHVLFFFVVLPNSSRPK